jgi:hypothetical protein
VSLVDVVADQTVDGDGIAFEELDAGDLDASIVASTVTNNGDDGSRPSGSARAPAP